MKRHLDPDVLEQQPLELPKRRPRKKKDTVPSIPSAKILTALYGSVTAARQRFLSAESDKSQV